MEKKAQDIILVSTADWDNPYWTNKQHMAVQFANRGHKVFYVESQGLRTPTVTTRDFRRVVRKLKRGLSAPRRVQENLLVWSPLVLPLHRFGFVRAINRLLLAIGIKFWCSVNKIEPDIFWTYSPLTTDLYNLSSYSVVVYHAVDDVKMQPGVPYDAVAKGEVALAKRADIIFTTASNLQAFYEKLNPRTFLYSNVADFDHFNKAMDENLEVPEELSKFSGPVIGFIGAISSYKLDFDLITTVAKQHPEWSFLFIGEVGEGDPLTDPSRLQDSPTVHLLGGRPYSSLPAYLKRMDVAILPSRLNDYTRSMFPMKFFEYLAAGKPVVSTDLPALQAYGDVAALCEHANEFATRISEALAGQTPALEDRLAAARQHTYETRLTKMWAHLEQLLEEREGSVEITVLSSEIYATRT